jgi:hypothetical protein
MKIPFLPIHIFTAKRLFKFADQVRERREKDNKIIGELLREIALLKGSTEYLLKVSKKGLHNKPAFAAGMDIARNSIKDKQFSGTRQ